jgi:hypothetical protein
MGRNIARRRSGGSELVLALWEGSVTRRGGVTTLTGGEAVPGTGKEVDNANWADTNLTGLKNKKKSGDRFNCYK